MKLSRSKIIAQPRVFALWSILIVSAGCSLIQEQEELRYRLTVEVQTPEGIRTGSSVIAVRGTKNPDWVNPEGRGVRSSFRGEAAVVDLPGGRPLFALLTTESGFTDAAEYPWLAFRDRLEGSPDALASIRTLRGFAGETAQMPSTEQVTANGGTTVSALPLLVAFKNTQDPKSVEWVDPQSIAKTFGHGVSLKRITVTISNDNVTTGIATRFKWLPEYRNKTFAGNRFAVSNSLADRLGLGSFSTEIPR